MPLPSIGNVTVWALESRVSLVVEKHNQFLAKNQNHGRSASNQLVTRRRFVFISRRIKLVLTHVCWKDVNILKIYQWLWCAE
jgi:hypothetical protein